MRERTRLHRAALAGALVVGLFAAPGLWAQERWFHVQVVDEGSEERVNVNVPLSLIEAAIRMIPKEIEDEVEMELNDVDIAIEDLRAFWQEVRQTEDAVFVTVESPDEKVRVAKEGNFLIARTVESTEDGAEVDVRFPFEVLNAMFADENRVDLIAAVRALAEYGDGDMVSVRDGDEHVRVWVDDQNEPVTN
jgi:hypothetical protein